MAPIADPTSSHMTNTCAVLYGAKDLRIEERAYAAPTSDEVQIRVRSTGLCGSDLHYFLHGRNGDFALQHPMCLGHESAGEVVALGSAVTTVRVGDRVAIEAGRMCGSCHYCKTGRYNLCQAMRFASSAKTFPHLDGTLQKYMNWPAALVHRIPDGVSFTSAALVEPLSVVIQGMRRCQIEAGMSVLVLGAGAVGLLACAAAKANGASFVAAVDIDQGRLQFATDNGWADATYLLPRTEAKQPQHDDDPRVRRSNEDKAIIEAAKESALAMLEALGNVEGFDLTFECTGVPSCVQAGIFATKPGGKEVLIGMGSPIQTLPIGAAALREVDILGVFRYANTYPVALGLLAGGGLRTTGGGRPANGASITEEGSETGKKMGGIENLLSHAYPLKDAATAFETLASGKDKSGRGVVKVFIVDNEP